MTCSKPDFLIAGAAKSGTSSLAYNLNCHPRILMPQKEVHYFSKKSNFGNDWYLSHFKHPDKIQGEKSTTYLYYTQCHKRMFELLPGAKIIILLRNPVDRAYSNWNMRYNDKRLIRQGLLFNRKHSKTLKSLDFSAIVNYYLDNINIIPEAHLFEPPLDIVHRGLYIQQIESLLKFYSMNKVRILITERYFENEKSNFTNLCHFLELKPHFPKSFATCKVGQYSKNLPSETKLKLREFYQPFNKKLFQLLNEPNVEWD